VSDGTGSSATFNLAMTVVPINDPPVIVGQNNVSTDEDTPREIVAGDLQIADVDSPGPFQVIVLAGANYTVAGTTLTPAPDFTGQLTVPVQVSDGVDTSAVFNMTVNIGAVNDAPVITAQQAVTTPEDTAITITVADHLVVTDVDNAQNELSVVLQSPLANANYSINGTTVTPDPDFNGTLTVPLQVSDGVNLSNVFNLSITVTPVNDAPSITSVPPGSAQVGQLYMYNITATDPDAGDTLTFNLSGVVPAWLTFTDNGDRTATLMGTPGPTDENTVVSLSLTVTDNAASPLTSDPQAISFTVIPAAVVTGFQLSAPTLADGATASTSGDAACWMTPQEQSLSATLPGDSALVAPLTFSLERTAANGDITVEPTGEFIYTPLAGGFRGRDTFDYLIEDASGNTVVKTATIYTHLKVMPLGDSVTTGVTDASDPLNVLPGTESRAGYRRPLYEALIAAGYGIDFVGSQAHGGGLTPAFDVDHEGHEGWSALELALGSTVDPNSGIYFWLDQNPTDIVLLHTGTDVPETSTDGIVALLDAIDRWEADTDTLVTVLIARIIDENPTNPEIVAFNNAIQRLADERFANGDDILAVDLRSALLGFDGLPDATLYGDAQHPNTAGYQEMADRWFGPLTSVLEKCP
jgi:hypothetical protein